MNIRIKFYIIYLFLKLSIYSYFYSKDKGKNYIDWWFFFLNKNEGKLRFLKTIEWLKNIQFIGRNFKINLNLNNWTAYIPTIELHRYLWIKFYIIYLVNWLFFIFKNVKLFLFFIKRWGKIWDGLIFFFLNKNGGKLRVFKILGWFKNIQFTGRNSKINLNLNNRTFYMKKNNFFRLFLSHSSFPIIELQKILQIVFASASMSDTAFLMRANLIYKSACMI